MPEAAAPQDPSDVSRWLRRLSLLPLVLLVAAYAAFPPFRDQINTGIRLLAAGDVKNLQAWGKNCGAWAPLATTVLMIVQAIAAPIPAFVVTATNSLLFGWFWGGLLSCFSATLAAVICFLLARTFGEPLVRRFISERARQRSERFMQEHGAAAVMAARLMPIVPFDPISYLAGLTEMRLSTFTWATLLGQLPAGMAYSYLTPRILAGADSWPKTLVLVVGTFAGLLILGWSFRRLVLKPSA